MVLIEPARSPISSFRSSSVFLASSSPLAIFSEIFAIDSRGLARPRETARARATVSKKKASPVIRILRTIAAMGA